MIILAMTGASGVIYGERILKALRGAGVRIGLMITDTAREIIRYELGIENPKSSPLTKPKPPLYSICGRRGKSPILNSLAISP